MIVLIENLLASQSIVLIGKNQVGQLATGQYNDQMIATAFVGFSKDEWIVSVGKIYCIFSSWFVNSENFIVRNSKIMVSF